MLTLLSYFNSMKRRLTIHGHAPGSASSLPTIAVWPTSVLPHPGRTRFSHFEQQGVQKKMLHNKVTVSLYRLTPTHINIRQKVSARDFSASLTILGDRGLIERFKVNTVPDVKAPT